MSVVIEKKDGITRYIKDDIYISFILGGTVETLNNEVISIKQPFSNAGITFKFDDLETNSKQKESDAISLIKYWTENDYFKSRLDTDLAQNQEVLLKSVVSCLSSIIEQNRDIIFLLQSINE